MPRTGEYFRPHRDETRPPPDQSASTGARNGACPECSGQVVSTGDHERVCTDCKLVVDADSIDYGPDWRAFTAEDKERKPRASQTKVRRHDKGLGSEIATSPDDSARLRRQQSLNRQTNGGKDRGRIRLYKTVEHLVSEMGFSDQTADRAATIARKGHEADLALGRSIEALATAATTAAFREIRFPIQFSELAPYVNVSKSVYYAVLDDLYSTLSLPANVIPPSRHVPRIASEIALPQHVVQTARQACDRIESDGRHAGYDPTSVAGGTLYLASQALQTSATPQEIADACTVTERSIRNHANYWENDVQQTTPTK